MKKMERTKYENLLFLTIDRYWFEKIAYGGKLEEYRDIKPFYDSRFKKEYKYVELRNGYSRKSPYIIIELKGVRKGIGKPEWGCPGNNLTYILDLGKIVELKDDKK